MKSSWAFTVKGERSNLLSILTPTPLAQLCPDLQRSPVNANVASSLQHSKSDGSSTLASLLGACSIAIAASDIGQGGLSIGAIAIPCKGVVKQSMNSNRARIIYSIANV